MAYTMSSFSSGPSASSNEHDDRKIFVGGLSWGTTDQDLQEYFSRFGSILDCVLKIDPATGRSRGFGFVLFSEASAVDEVLAQTHTLQGRAITPRKVRKGMNRDREPILKVFVGGLDPSVPEQDIWDHFGAYGKVTDLDLPYDSNKGCRRAFCFVSFETEEAVDAACREEKQEIGGKWVDVKRAIPRTQRNGWFGNSRGGGSGGAGGGGYGGGSGGGYGGGSSGGYGSSGYGGSGGYGGTGGYSSGGSGYGGGGGSSGYSGGGRSGGYGGGSSYNRNASGGGYSSGGGYNKTYSGQGRSYSNSEGNGYDNGSYVSRGSSGGRGGGRYQSQGQGWGGRQQSYGSGGGGYYSNNNEGYE